MIPAFLPGTTIELTMTSSGNSADSSSYCVRDRGETVINSGGAFTSSGNGLYYAPVTVPTTPGFYVADAVLVVNGRPYRKRKRFESALIEVD